jgi:hypothetical protein
MRVPESLGAHLEAANLATLRDTLVGNTIIVRRKDTTEKIEVVKVTSLEDGSVNFNDGNRARSVKGTAIVSVK